MYEIYAYPYGNPDAKLLLYRPNDPQALVLSPKLTREVSKGGSLIFTMTRDHAQYDMLQKLSTVVQVRRDDKEIWRGRVLKHEADFYNRRVVYCEGALSYFNDSSITPFNYKGTLRQFLQHLIDAHNDQVKSKMKCFQLGTVTAALGNLVVQFGDADQYGVGEDYGKVWDILDKLVLKVFGGYFYCNFDAATGLNVLNYCDQAVEAKRQTAQKIEYGRNLLNLSETTDATDLYTRIYPIGNKHTVDTSKWYYKLMWWRDPSKDKHEERWGIMGTDAATVAQYLPASGYSYNLEEGWIQNDAAVQKFGIITRIVELDTDSANDTFAAGVQALQQNYAMKTSYVIRAVDLVDAGYDTDRLDFSMYSHIISAPHSVDAVMLCTKLVEPLEKPAQKEFTFGMTRRTLTDRQVANMGTTNLLMESAYTSEKYHQDMLKRLFAYQSSTDGKIADISKGLTNAVTKMGDLQDQIDDNITSWFYAGEPTAANEPAKDWTTDTAKKQHIGDLYYDKLTGLGYRWVLDGSTYSWVVIRDTGVAKALADAAAAQAAADGKVRCFGATPTPPYDRGDIWMQGTDGDIMRCQTPRYVGEEYNAGDWVKASKYTDDTLAKTVAGNLAVATSKIASLQTQVDGKVETWYYSAEPTIWNAPASSWTDYATRKLHIGDLYYNLSNGRCYHWTQNGSSWRWELVRDTDIQEALTQAKSAQAAADGKIRCFTAIPYPPYDVGDLWAQGSTGDIMRCQTSRQSGSYQAADWVKASKYTDDTAANQAKQDAAEAAKTATNFLEFTPQNGLIVRHDSLPGKRVQILNDGIRVMDGSSMVNIQSNAISITDGMGSCSISSGAITFNGIRNNKIFEWPYEKDSHGNPTGGFDAQTTKIDLSSYSSVMLVYDTQKEGTWFASGGGAGRLTVVLPVNGQTYSYAYPWNTVHWRTVKVSDTGITFGSGNERTSSYSGTTILGVWSFNLQNPGGDGVTENNKVCRPLELYGFM